MINRLILCFTLLFSTTYGIKAINVRDCGAIGDGKHIDSPAINSAIEKAALTGDTVIVPAGTFMCYSALRHHTETGAGGCNQGGTRNKDGRI